MKPELKGLDSELTEKRIKLSLSLPGELMGIISDHAMVSGKSVGEEVKHFIELEFRNHLIRIEPRLQVAIEAGEGLKIFDNELPDNWREGSKGVVFELPKSEYDHLLRLKEQYQKDYLGLSSEDHESRNLFFARLVYDAIKHIEFLQSPEGYELTKKKIQYLKQRGIK